MNLARSREHIRAQIDRLRRIKREPDKLLIRKHLESNAVGLVGASLSNAEPVLMVTK